MLEQRIEQDLKAALLGGDAARVLTLRTLKGAILNVKVADGSRGIEMPDAQMITLLSKEAKKRQESADLYVSGGRQDRADAELAEKKLIEGYLPKQLTQQELTTVIDEIMMGYPDADKSSMGKIIGEVKEKTAGSADGSMIARLVKERIEQ